VTVLFLNKDKPQAIIKFRSKQTFKKEMNKLSFVNTIEAPHDSFTTDRSHIMYTFMKIKISTFSKSPT
jgi:hypothetical protein